MIAIPRVSTAAIFLLSAAISSASCTSERTKDREAVPTYKNDVAALLGARCSRCHAGAAPAGDFRADSYVGAIGCAQPDRVFPIVEALGRPDHAGFASNEEREVLARWVSAASPSVGNGVHPAAFANPRAPNGHVQFLRARRYAPLFDPSDRDACAHCHDGAGPRPAGIVHAADGATACTSCHSEKDFPNGCSSCHGKGDVAYPPRDRCFHPDERVDTAHAKHASAGALREQGLACTTCHPTPTAGRPDPLHVNGYVDVWFDFALAGSAVRFDPNERRCSGSSCHARGGARPAPAWTDGPMGCGDCHSSPPANHYKGECTTCHREANADGTKLFRAQLHANGVVDLGDGSGKCGACHGEGDSPWPKTGAHAAHMDPKSSAPVACDACHELPTGRHPVGKGSATVKLGYAATRGGRRATYDGATKTCAGTYCHEASGATMPAPVWSAAGSVTCTSCHATPPPPPHPASTACSSAGCHAGIASSATVITPAGKAVHVNGRIDRALP